MGEVALAFLSGFEWDEQKQMCVACPLGNLYDHKVLQKNPPNSNICAKNGFLYASEGYASMLRLVMSRGKKKDYWGMKYPSTIQHSNDHALVFATEQNITIFVLYYEEDKYFWWLGTWVVVLLFLWLGATHLFGHYVMYVHGTLYRLLSSYRSASARKCK